MKKLAGPWERFWFTASPTSTLAVVRIAYGAVLVVWALSLAPDLFAFFSGSGIIPSRPLYPGAWTLLEPFDSGAAIVVLFVVLVAAAACLMVGFHTRLAAVAAVVAIQSFTWRNPLVLNSGDGLLRLFGLFLVVSPAGAALSVDRWRSQGGRCFWEFPSRSSLGLRLIQVQLSMVYVFSVWTKLRGTTWNDGTAVSYVLRLEELSRFPLPSWVMQSPVVSNVLTYGTLGIEVALAGLIWNRRARRWVIPLGVVMHLLIDLAITVGFFSLVLFVGYLAFVPHEAMSAAVLAVRNRLRRSSLRPLRRLGWSPGSPELPPLPPARPREKADATTAVAPR